MTEKRLPPGKRGLPVLGETLAFMKDTFGFIAARRAAHGPIFRTHLLGNDTAVLCGAETVAPFLDEERVQRADAMPSHLKVLFGGVSVNQMDGAEHRARKRLILAAFTREAMASYLPAMEATVGRRFAAWADGGEVALVPELKRLAVEVICDNVMGPAGDALDALVEDYRLMTVGAGSLPLRVPGTGFARGAKAVERLLARHLQVVRAHRAERRDDGLARILAAGDISDEECARELHHLIVAGMIIFAELAALVIQLARHPEVRARLAEEVARLAPGSTPATLESLAAMPYLGRVVAEVKRSTPMLPGVFARAKADLEVGGYTIPAGWTILWALRQTHVEEAVYPAPERFDPDRFADGRAEHARHAHAFVPQGAGEMTGHKCAGLDYATYLMQLFAVALARDYDVDLATDQVLDYDWSLIPPEPRDGLVARVRRRA